MRLCTELYEIKYIDTYIETNKIHFNQTNNMIYCLRIYFKKEFLFKMEVGFSKDISFFNFYLSIKLAIAGFLT